MLIKRYDHYVHAHAPPRIARGLAGLGVAAALALASVPAGADDSCPAAHDGVCDELRSCALGTDETDCVAACAGAWSPDIVGACAHYGAVLAAAPPAPSPDTGSHGQGGVTGVWAGNITAKGNKPQSDIVRHYLVYVPPTYDPRVPTPLVYMLGGFTVDMYGLSAYTELMRTADLNGFIVVFPQQHYYDFGDPIGWVFAWNVYKTDWAGGDWQDNPDVDFIRVLSAELKKKYNVDRTRIFASGHSRGAGMSIILAFELPDTIAGFLSESGFIQANKFDVDIAAYAGSRKIPGVLVHGTKDMDVPVGNSDFTKKTLLGRGWVADQDFLYFRLDHVAHEWQPQYSQQAWDFLRARPLPLEEAAP